LARDQEPVSEEEVDALCEEIAEQREEIREALIEDLGGDPEDYDAAKYLNDRAGEPVVDGGDDFAALVEAAEDVTERLQDAHERVERIEDAYRER